MDFLGDCVTPRLKVIIDDIYKKCRDCGHRTELPRGPPISLPKSGVFNKVISMDLLWVACILVWILHMCDVLSRLSALCACENRSTSVILNGYLNMWQRPYGAPDKVLVDSEGGLTGYVASELFASTRTEVEIVPPNHHASLPVERQHPMVSSLAETAFSDPETKEDLESGEVSIQDVCNNIGTVKNSLMMYSGLNSFQW